jgi:hypothetical protein
MGPKHVKSPDGLEWEVSATNFRAPRWRENSYDPWRDDYNMDPFLWKVFATVVVLPIMIVVVPALLFVFEYPVAIVRGLFTKVGWVEAVSWYPNETRITWRVAERRLLEIAQRDIANALTRGYDGLQFEEAKIVAVTRPAALNDLSS